MIDDNFAASDEVAIDNPLGGIRRGAEVPHKMYEVVFQSAADVHVEFWDYTIHRVGDVFWVVGRERGTYHDGDTVKDLNIRTTRVFRTLRRPLATGSPSRFDRGRKASRGLSERSSFTETEKRCRDVLFNAKVRSRRLPEGPTTRISQVKSATSGTAVAHAGRSGVRSQASGRVRSPAPKIGQSRVRRAWVEAEPKDVGDQALMRGLVTAFPIMRPGLFLSYCGRRHCRPQSV